MAFEYGVTDHLVPEHHRNRMCGHRFMNRVVVRATHGPFTHNPTYLNHKFQCTIIMNQA